MAALASASFSEKGVESCVLMAACSRNVDAVLVVNTYAFVAYSLISAMKSETFPIRYEAETR